MRVSQMSYDTENSSQRSALVSRPCKPLPFDAGLDLPKRDCRLLCIRRFQVESIPLPLRRLMGVADVVFMPDVALLPQPGEQNFL